MIDVILPTYNQSEFLNRSINAILDQTFKEFNLIIVNDGSTDETANILKQYDQKNILIYTQENKKLPASLNIGHSLGKNPYCTWISTDNISYNNQLEKLFDFIVKNDFDFVQSLWHKTKNNETVTINASSNIGPFKVGNLGASFLYKREVWDKFKYDENLIGVEDTKFFLDIKYKSNFKTGFLDEPLVHYFVQPNSMSKTLGKVYLKSQIEKLRSMYEFK